MAILFDLPWQAFTTASVSRSPISIQLAPTKAEVRIARAHVDLDDVDALGLGALQQLGVGLHVGVMDDDSRGLLRDQRRHCLRAGIGAPVGVADHDLHAIGLEASLDAGEPTLGEIEVHRHRNVGDGLAGEGLLERTLKRLVESLLGKCRGAHRANQRRSAGEPADPAGRVGFNHDLVSSVCVSSPRRYFVKYLPAARFPHCAD